VLIHTSLVESNQSKSHDLVDVTSLDDDVKLASLKVSKDKSIKATDTLKTENINSPKHEDSILEKLNAECSNLTSTVPLPNLLPCVNATESEKSTVVRKRGRPRKHFSTKPPLSNNPRPSSNALNSSNPFKKRRKRKVKGYPWGPNKKKKKILTEVR